MVIDILSHCESLPYFGKTYFWDLSALPWEHFISIDAGCLAPQLSYLLHPFPVPKSLQPPEHDNHWSLLKHLPILIASFSRGLSVRLITLPVEAVFEVNSWQNRSAPKSLSQNQWPQIGDHIPFRNTSGNLPSTKRTPPLPNKTRLKLLCIQRNFLIGTPQCLRMDLNKSS